MKTYEIKLDTGRSIETARIEINRRESRLSFLRESGFRKIYTDHDLFLCLAKIRKEFSEIKFLCKGAKLNVFPSRMCSQMGRGMVAYELTMEKSATFDDIVHIFDYEESNISKTPKEQNEFYINWLKSLTPK
ncbi:hypothetical protein [Pseudomonas sp. IT-P253]|jgi:hypothetical protein|uniref:hypothetical protein n=1 Tax=Pseudomonas sp. IT-P253 TaxID=3026455 RepID=UPI0039E029F9